jgi:predicted RNA binding protein YcfA (HicA-like mRNA interferase family)
MKYSSQKDIDKAIRGLLREGWSFWRGSKHGRLRAPSGRNTVTVSVTPGDRNALKTFYANVKRAGGR